MKRAGKSDVENQKPLVERIQDASTMVLRHLIQEMEAGSATIQTRGDRIRSIETSLVKTIFDRNSDVYLEIPHSSVFWDGEILELFKTINVEPGEIPGSASSAFQEGLCEYLKSFWPEAIQSPTCNHGEYQIRAFKPEYAAQMLSFVRRCETELRQTGFTVLPRTPGETLKWMYKEAKLHKVAFNQDEIVGLAGAVEDHMGKRSASSAGVFYTVAKDHQGRGIAPKMIKEMANTMREVSPRIDLFVFHSEDNNEASMAVARKLGAKSTPSSSVVVSIKDAKVILQATSISTHSIIELDAIKPIQENCGNKKPTHLKLVC